MPITRAFRRAVEQAVGDTGGLTVGNIAILSGRVDNLADDASVNILPTGGVDSCLLWVYDAGNHSGLFCVAGSGGTVAEVSDPNSTMANTDTDGMTCVFASGGNLVLRNRRGGSRSYRWVIVKFAA
jgi:hypothetical protein